MIAHLHGQLRQRDPNRIIVDVHGVGYELHVPVGTWAQLPALGSEVSLHVYTQVRDDAIQLFGFAAAAEKLLFEKLITVNGVGPKLALAILSGLEPRALGAAIRQGDLARLTAIPGVGRKTAERLVVELRDKMPAELAADETPPVGALGQDVASALENLGYPAAVASKAVERARREHPEAGFDELFLLCMKSMR